MKGEIRYLGTGGVAHEHDGLLAYRPEILDEGSDVGHVVDETLETELRKGTSQPKLEDRVAQIVVVLEGLGNGLGVRNRVRSITEAADENQCVLGRRGSRFVGTCVLSGGGERVHDSGKRKPGKSRRQRGLG